MYNQTQNTGRLAASDEILDNNTHEWQSKDCVFYYDSRRAGGGKTYDIVSAACQRAARGQKCLIVQPTTRLIDETFQEVSFRFPLITVHKFHSDDGNSVNVSSRVMAYLNNADLGGVVLFVSHRTLINLPYFHRRKDWAVFLDECPNAFETFDDRLPVNHTIITDHVQLVDFASAYSRVEVTNHHALSMTARNQSQDSILAQVQDLAKILVSPNYDSYVNIEKFENLKRKSSNDGRLSIFSILSPNLLRGFDRVTISAARFEDTFAYHHWSKSGIKLKKSRELHSDTTSLIHPYNPSIAIYYGYEVRYSKYLRDRLGGDNTPIIAAATKRLGNDRFVRVENNDVKLTSPLGKLAGDNLIPGISHGLNCYKDIHHAVTIIAANQTPEASRFLREYFDFDDDKQFTAFTNHSVYQAICRTSIRQNDQAHNKIWIVASKDTADWLSEIFPGSRVESLGLVQPVRKQVGRKRTHKTDNERKNASKNRSRVELSLASGFAQNIDASYLQGIDYLENGDESAIKDISHFVARFRASYFRDYFSTDPYVICKTENQFITYLRDHSKNVYTSKNEIPCVSGAMFDVNKSNHTNRGNSNVEFVRGIWIDIEKGTMTHDDFSRSFPLLHFVAYNTFSHTKDRPRFRIYIPTSRVMTDYEYRLVYAEIIYVLESKGYRSQKLSDAACRKPIEGIYHGIDHLPHPCAVFALPCQAQDRSESFFKEYKGDCRISLDVDSWLVNRIAPDDNESIRSAFDNSDEDGDLTITPDQQAGIDASLNEWYRVGVLPGEGHDALFALYHSLYALKLHPRAISERLSEAARSACSPKDRQRQADRLMTGLRRWCQSRRHHFL